MSKIHAFIAIHPEPNHAAEVSCEPYDVIGTEDARAKAEASPNSFLRVIRSEIEFPEDTNPYSDSIYERARDNLEKMLAKGVLMEDEEPGMFVYRLVQDGRSQVGLVCTVDAEEYRADRIRKHEKTRPDKEDDRTNHLLAVSGHAEPVFLSWHDSPDDTRIVDTLKREMGERPLMHFVADGVTHTLWRVDDTKTLQELFNEVPDLYIADGHHRSAAGERASRTRAEDNPSHTGAEEYNRILAVVFPESQLTILAYNRLVQDLNGLSPEECLRQLATVGTISPLGDGDRTPEGKGQVNVFISDAWYTLVFNPESIDHQDPIASLDVALLQDRVLAPILGIGDPRTDTRIGFVGGIHGPDELERRVREGDWMLAFSMYPTSMEELLRVADSGKIMPPKSTWFEPKLRSGLFIHRFESSEKCTP
ncbi:MAG: DUF1015 family protein [Phycisphaerales bacterium]|nr:DUF1015 family protein [Phycisphaerales bacterium]